MNPTSDRTYAAGWHQAQADLTEGIVRIGDPGFQPPIDDYQAGYNDCIEAPSGPGVIGCIMVIAMSLGICGLLYMVLVWAFK